MASLFEEHDELLEGHLLLLQDGETVVIHLLVPGGVAEASVGEVGKHVV